MFEELLEWDRSTLIYLNNLSAGNYVDFWSTVTEWTTWIPLFLLFIVLLLWKHGGRGGLLRILSILMLLLVVLGLMYAAKEGFGRVRPNNDLTLSTLIRVLKNPTDPSFFSGHAATSFSITVLVFMFLRKKIMVVALFFAWPLLFTSSRIFAGVHYPLDVITGTLVGVVLGLLGYKMHNRVFEKNKTS